MDRTKKEEVEEERNLIRCKRKIEGGND